VKGQPQRMSVIEQAGTLAVCTGGRSLQNARRIKDSSVQQRGWKNWKWWKKTQDVYRS